MTEKSHIGNEIKSQKIDLHFSFLVIISVDLGLV